MAWITSKFFRALSLSIPVTADFTVRGTNVTHYFIGKGAKLKQYEKVSLAMALRGKNAHYHLNSIQTRHWFELAQSVGIEGLWERMIDTVERAPGAIASLEKKLAKGFPERVYVAIAKGIDRHAKEFLGGIKRLKA